MVVPPIIGHHIFALLLGSMTATRTSIISIFFEEKTGLCSRMSGFQEHPGSKALVLLFANYQTKESTVFPDSTPK